MLPCRCLASSFRLDEVAGGSRRGAAAGRCWIPSCASLARFRATLTNSTRSTASTTVAAAGWGEDERGGEDGEERETNPVTVCRGRCTAGRLCARRSRPAACAGPAEACSCRLRGKLIVARWMLMMQNKEGLVCGACAEALLCLRFFFSVDGVRESRSGSPGPSGVKSCKDDRSS